MLSWVVWDERGIPDDGNGADADGHCQYRARASFLFDRLPRTLALVSELARLEAERVRRRRGIASQSDLFARELFKLLAGVHDATFGRKPVTRGNAAETIAGSIDWARAVIRHGADAIEASPRPMPFKAVLFGEEVSPAKQAEILAQSANMAAPFITRFRELAGLTDRRVGDMLETGWRDWERQNSATARGSAPSSA